MNCLLGDAGIAIGLTSLPFRQELNFYEREIAGSLFPNYKKAVLNNFSSELKGLFDSDFRRYFYEPIPYYLFGSFDLAVVTLVDDFEMTARTFRPFDPMLLSGQSKPYQENFFYKVITGPTPQFRPDDSIVQIAARTFLQDDRLPLFAMSLLKINNALLLGTGTEFLRLVVRFIHAEAKRQKAAHQDLEVILLESHSAHEITLLILTSSYSAATDLITTVREARVSDLLRGEGSGSSQTELISLLKSSLLADLIASESSSSFDSATLFTDSESYFGFDFRLLDSKQRWRLERIDENDSLDLLCQWTVRPGNLITSIDELARMEIGKVSVGIGRGDLFVQSQGQSTRTVVEQVVDSLYPDSLPKHARRRQTIPAVPRNTLPVSPPEESLSASNLGTNLSQMRFTVDEIKVTQDRLRAIGTPKILTGKVLNAFSNFNDGMLDPSLYGYFIELLPLMESLQHTVDSWYEDRPQPDIGHICATLEKVTDNFERAYRNRFYNSYRMGDITDFNLNFKGGIQQLLTSFDAAYKAICSVLGTPGSFAYVAGSPGVYSTAYEVRLNYYHVFQPEIFGCILNHETANSYLARFNGKKAPGFAKVSSLIMTGENSDGESIPERLVKIRVRANSYQQTLLDHVTPRLFKYVLVDLLAFFFGYNRNLRLFSYWYWGYFSQSSVAYAVKGTVDEIQFVDFMLRMLWIERMIGLPEYHGPSFGVNAFDDLFRFWRPMLSDFLAWLWEDDQIREWNNEVVTHVESKFREVHGLLDCDETITDICKRLEGQAAKTKDKIERGEVCLYSKVDENSAFRFTEQLYYAYLSLLADRVGQGEILLIRREDGRPNLKPANSKAVFDPIGGIFTYDPVTRREVFRYRAGLTMSLWDMAQKEKKQLVLKRLSRPNKRSTSEVLDSSPI